MSGKILSVDYKSNDLFKLYAHLWYRALPQALSNDEDPSFYIEKWERFPPRMLGWTLRYVRRLSGNLLNTTCCRVCERDL